MEFSLGNVSESEDDDDDVIEEDKEVEAGAMRSPTRKVSTGSCNRPRRRRSRRRRRTCIAQFNLSEQKSTKEDEVQSSSPGLFRKETLVRRCFSFGMFSRSFSMFDMKKQASSSSSRNIDCDTQSNKTSRSSLCRSSSSRFSEPEERFRSPVKRKISLKEYHIVKREACHRNSMEENERNSSL